MATVNSEVKINQSQVLALVDSMVYERETNLLLLQNFKIHLLRIGKICPKPWYWGRFFNVFQPKYESHWLMGWWQTRDEEKRDRFMLQLDYLAQQTLHFKSAYRFLCGLEDKDWHCTREHRFTE